MTFEKLSSLIEQNNFTTKTDFIVAVKLLDAENDWPEPSVTVNEFILKLEQEIGNEIFYQTLVSKLETYHVRNDAWKIESLSSIQEIIELDIQRDLKKIVNEFIQNNT